MSEVETNLSRARLKLLDKKKSIREAVHQHYRELIGVAEHASRMNDMLESVVESHVRLGSLTRALRVKAATAQLSTDGRYGCSSSPKTSDPPNPNIGQGNVLGLNARVLFLATKMEFNEISKLLKSGIRRNPQLVASSPDESPDFIPLESRVISYCWRAISSPNLVSLSNFSSCVELLESLVPNADLGPEFYSRRKALIISTESLADKLRFFDITMSISAVCHISPDESFEADLCRQNGLITTLLFTELGRVSIHFMLEQYLVLKDAIEDCRKESSISGHFDVLSVLETTARHLSEKAVRSAIEDVSISSLNMDRLVENLATLSKELTKFDVWSIPDAESLLGRELDMRLLQATRDCDHTDRGSAINACAIAHALNHSLKHLSSYLNSSVAAINQLARDSFDLYFDRLVSDFFSSSHTLDNTPDKSDEVSVFNYSLIDGVCVPSHLSPVMFDVSFGVCCELTRLPLNSLEVSRLSAKSALSRFFASFLSSLKHVSLQTLFDAVSASILTSAVDDSIDYDFLANKVVLDIQKKALPDQVDLLLFKDFVSSAAASHLIRNAACFQPLLIANPAITVHADLSVVPGGSLLESLANKGEKPIDRFPTLPVAKSGPQHVPSIKTSMHQSKRQTASVVTSFFNQVGKITLGANQK